MKRQIVCIKCHKVTPTPPGEMIKIVSGTARHDMFCDLCGRDIMKGDNCYAESIWLEYRHKYYALEHKYLKFNQENNHEPETH